MSASGTFGGLVAVCIIASAIVVSKGINNHKYPHGQRSQKCKGIHELGPYACQRLHCLWPSVPSVACAPTQREVGSGMTKLVPIDPVVHTVLLPLEVTALIFWVVHVAMPVAALYRSWLQQEFRLCVCIPAEMLLLIVSAGSSVRPVACCLPLQSRQEVFFVNNHCARPPVQPQQPLGDKCSGQQSVPL